MVHLITQCLHHASIRLSTSRLIPYQTRGSSLVLDFKKNYYRGTVNSPLWHRSCKYPCEVENVKDEPGSPIYEVGPQEASYGVHPIAKGMT